MQTETTQALEETEIEDLRGQVEAIRRSNAVIEFDLDGTIRTANQNFLSTLGYTLAEIQGKHHRMFADPSYAQSREYEQFWQKLRAGDYQAGEFKRLGKGGKEVWIQASYNPIFGTDGRPVKVVKYASDITEQKMRNADYQGQLDAIGRSQAVIEFELDGTIRVANQNFLKAFGYSLAEIQGKHHRMLVDPVFGKSREYEQFWQDLRAGKCQSDEFRRLGKGGKAVWIQASYNPILDLGGKLVKVVKYATDITERVNARLAVTATAKALARSSESLRRLSIEMSANSKDNTTQAQQAAQSADQVSSNTHSLASATEQMHQSINEISQSASMASKVGHEAVAVAQMTNQTVSKLGDSSAEIGQVIKVITGIAQQTNLLALNATIEAARAGEAGKGFAVVANEVKELAKETANATKDISDKISAIQSNTGEAVKAIARISAIINQINEIQTTIASAVEEQSSTTSEMTRSVSFAARGVEGIVANVSGLASAATKIEAGAHGTEQAAQELATMASQLEGLVARF